MKRDIVYSVCCLAFAIIIGGAVYEHLNVVPKWAAAPPVSLSMFQGEYGLKPDLFWKIIHPVNILLFVVALVFNRRYARRSNIIFVLTGYIIILVVTAIYFVPELMSITSTAFSAAGDPELVRRASLWELLSIIRLVILVVLSIKLFMGLTKTGERSTVKRNAGYSPGGKTVAA
jgi:hypothetical protein